MKPFKLQPIPFEYDALEPFISRETLTFHHDKHHRGYVDRLNSIISGSGFEGSSLEKIIKESNGALFEQAAQIWNHEFYWNSLTPDKLHLSEYSVLTSALIESFGSVEKFKSEFERLGSSLFGSGWLWLVSNQWGTLKLFTTKDAENPMLDGLEPLLVCDLWEHAYYIDYRNVRAKYLSNFYKIINWKFAAENFKRHDIGRRISGTPKSLDVSPLTSTAVN